MERPPMLMAEKSPLLSPGEFRQLQWALGSLLGALSAGTVLFLDIEAWGLLASILGAALLMFFRADLPARVPAWAHRLAFPVILCLFGWDLWNAAGFLPALIRLSLWLLLYRSVCYRTRREDLQLVLLGLFLIVIAGVITVSIAFSVLLVLFTLCALSLLLVVTTGDSLAASTGNSALWHESYNVWRLGRRLWQTLDWKQVIGGLLLFAVLVGASAVIFVSMPRFQMQNSLFLERLFPHKTSTGFSDTIRFGEVTEIAQNTALAFTVDVPADTKLASTPYFRMLVLDEYLAGGGFRASASLKRDFFQPERSRSVMEGVPVQGGPEGAAWTIYLEPGIARNLPLPGDFSRLRLRDPLVLRFALGLRLVQLRDDPLAMLPFRVEGALDSARIVDSQFAQRIRQHDTTQRERQARRLFLELPSDEASLRLLRAQVAQGGLAQLSAQAFAERLLPNLASQHLYSLNSTLPAGSGDAVIRWMGSKQPGHCELFAATFVLLARASGHPARVVVGFRGGRWNSFSNSLSIRNSDAHAWCEIWDGDKAWLRVDPTPGASLFGTQVDSPVAGVAADNSFSARFEGLRVLWYRKIVNFDQQSQLDALVKAKRNLNEWREAWRARMEGLKVKAESLFDSRYRFAVGGLLFGVLVLGIVLSYLAVRWHRHWRWHWKGARSRNTGRAQDPVRREAGRWLRRLQTHKAAPCDLEQLQALRYGAHTAWPSIDQTFTDARRAHRRLKKMGSAKT